jgi:hypothetical protein
MVNIAVKGFECHHSDIMNALIHMPCMMPGLAVTVWRKLTVVERVGR